MVKITAVTVARLFALLVLVKILDRSLGMFEEIGKRFKVALRGVPTVGDSLRDLQAGFKCGCAPYLVLTGKGQKTMETGGLPPGTQVFPDLASMVNAFLKAAPQRPE